MQRERFTAEKSTANLLFALLRISVSAKSPNIDLQKGRQKVLRSISTPTAYWRGIAPRCRVAIHTHSFVGGFNFLRTVPIIYGLPSAPMYLRRVPTFQPRGTQVSTKHAASKTHIQFFPPYANLWSYTRYRKKGDDARAFRLSQRLINSPNSGSPQRHQEARSIYSPNRLLEGRGLAR